LYVRLYWLGPLSCPNSRPTITTEGPLGSGRIELLHYSVLLKRKHAEISLHTSSTFSGPLGASCVTAGGRTGVLTVGVLPTREGGKAIRKKKGGGGRRRRKSGNIQSSCLMRLISGRERNVINQTRRRPREGRYSRRTRVGHGGDRGVYFARQRQASTTTLSWGG
jgi:hypothetical protein